MSYAKSRLTVAKEVLTGTYVDYWCKTDPRTAATGHAGLTDLGYPIPHTIPCSNAGGIPACKHPAQKADGLLDLRKDDFLFGLMTFDAIENAGAGETGGFSYGTTTAAGINLGIKNSSWGAPNQPDVWDPTTKTWTTTARTIENNGQLIPPWTPLSDVSLDGWNQLLQREIQDLVGYWGTPISPMVVDVADFMESDPRVGLPPSVANPHVGDPYADCRERVAILITDGRASQGEDSGGYPSTVKALQQLQGSPSWADPKYATRVFVIGYYGAGAASGTDPLQVYRDYLGEDRVYQAESPATLAKALSKIFSKAMTGNHSRTPVVITNATQARNSKALQLRFSAGFRGDGDDPNDGGADARNLIGYLDARVIGCADDGVSVAAHQVGLLQPDLDGLGQQAETDRQVRFIVGKKIEKVVDPDGSVNLNKLKDGSIQYDAFLGIDSANGDATDPYAADSGGAAGEPLVDMGACQTCLSGNQCCEYSDNTLHEISCESTPQCMVPLSVATQSWDPSPTMLGKPPCSELLSCIAGMCTYPAGNNCTSDSDCYFKSWNLSSNSVCDWSDAGSGTMSTGTDVIGAFDNPDVRKTFAKRLIRLIASAKDADPSVENPRAKPNANGRYIRRLGGLSRATPVVQEPAELGRYALASWNDYVETPQQENKIYPAGCRPTVLYAGSHDGLLHAFRVDLRGPNSPACPNAPAPQWGGGDLDLTDSGLRKNFGRELWAIMPSELLKRAQALATSVAYLMDGPLVVQDVLLKRSAPTGTGPNPDEWKNWRSVLVASYGNGGRGFLALDVTVPDDLDTVKLLWEIGSKRMCNANGCHVYQDEQLVEGGWNFENIGNTTGAPAFGTAFLGGKEVAVAILPGGDKPADAPADWTPTVYVVRVDTGRILRAFQSPDDIPFTGSASAYPSTPGVVTTRAYLGDAGGRLWRIKMVGQPSAWALDGPYDDFYGASAAAGSRQPILGTAKVAPVGFGRVEIIVGLGQEGHTANGASQGAVLSYEDMGTEYPLTLRWLQPLDPGEYLTGEPVVFGKKVHFSTAVEPSNGSLCASQSGRIWTLHYANHSGTDPVGLASTISMAGCQPEPNDRYCAMAEVPFGVQMVQLPACVDTNIIDSTGGDSTASQGGMKLVANIADTASTPSDPLSTPPASGEPVERTEVKASSTNEYNETLQSAAWGYVLY